jgi:hypothetical protein
VFRVPGFTRLVCFLTFMAPAIVLEEKHDDSRARDSAKKVLTGQISVPSRPASTVEAAKQLAAYAAVDDHIKPTHKVIGIGYVFKVCSS